MNAGALPSLCARRKRAAEPACGTQHAPSNPDVAPASAGRGLTAVTTVAALLSGIVLMLVGCASPGDIRPTHALVQPGALGARAGEQPWPAARWWSAYGDPQLDRLVDQALAGQPNLRATQARLQQAQAVVDTSRAARLPQVNGSVDLTHQRFTENGLVPPQLAGAIRWNNNAQIGASWEFDLFGRQRAALDGSIGQLRAAQADAQAAGVLLAGNVAASYFNLARLLEARDVALESLKQREQVFALVRQRISAGLDTSVELRQAEGLIAQSRVEVEALGESMANARHALAELTGQGPHALETLEPRLAALRSTALPAVLPADLIGRRADLAAQRWRVEATQSDVDVARAQFYPNLNLAAFVGLSSIGLDQFVNAGSRTFGAGPALRLPIFDAGRLRANLSARSAEVDLAVEAYNAALLRALREVADEVSSQRSLERQQRSQADATSAADSAYDLALQRYRAGLGNFLTVLTAQTNVLTQRRASTELKARHLTSEISLNRALGGGYSAEALPSVAAAH
jgi:NodT family efflux transporter outer membrane factor (OMF) lipoprotein